VRALRELDERRQEAGERLAGACRRDEQRRTSGARLRKQLKLMRPRRPAAALEPAPEALGEERRLDRVALLSLSLGHDREVTREEELRHPRVLILLAVSSPELCGGRFEGACGTRRTRSWA